MAFKVIIVGGGLAGSLLASGLLNNGVDVTLYERDPADAHREGYQIRLGDSALIGFKACLTESHIAKIEHKFGQSSHSSSTAPIIKSSDFKTILDLSTLPTYSRSYAINRVVLRNILIQPVKEAGKVHFGKEFSHYRIIPKPGEADKIRVIFGDGFEDDGDILIAADGSGSKINQQIGAKNLVPLTDWKAFLAKGAVPLKRIQELPQELLKGPFITFTKCASFFYALYLPPPEQPTTDREDGFDYAADEASFYWGLILHQKFFEGKDLSSKSKRRQICLDFANDRWAPDFKDLMLTGADDDDSNDVYMAPLRASNKLSRTWRTELRQRSGADPELGHPQVWLLGDAIHAMQPNRGMGGNQALHDCADILPPLLQLSSIANSGTSLSKYQLEEACRLYENAMIDRAFKWVQKSGGTSVGTIDLDGVLGTAVWLAGKLILPVVSVFYRIFGIGKTV